MTIDNDRVHPPFARYSCRENGSKLIEITETQRESVRPRTEEKNEKKTEQTTTTSQKGKRRL